MVNIRRANIIGPLFFLAVVTVGGYMLSRLIPLSWFSAALVTAQILLLLGAWAIEDDPIEEPAAAKDFIKWNNTINYSLVLLLGLAIAAYEYLT